jgi:glucan phosphoethanolaminetransferase (alkaline phosphatase superfamily)
MNYGEWNETIATHFFNSSNAGKYIQLYLTKEDLIKCAKTKFTGKSNEQIWNDYLYAIKYNDQEDTPFKKVISLL